MVSDLKCCDGKVSQIDRVPADLRALYATFFETRVIEHQNGGPAR